MNGKNILMDVTTSLFGDTKIAYEFEKCIKNKKKFQIQINGFSGNWVNINVKFQEGDVNFKHYTLNKRKL